MNMKNLKELSNDEYQSFLTTMFDDVEFTGLIFESEGVNIDCCGLEYKLKNDTAQLKRILPFSNPELIIWLYEKETDLSIPLRQLKYDYVELDETNSLLFEYAMSINRVLNENIQDDVFHGQGNKKKIGMIKEIQKELVSKI